MKDYGIQESWSKEYRICTLTFHGRWLHGLYEPISHLSNGAILLFHRLGNAVVYYDPKTHEFYFFKLRGIKSKFEAIAHTPSFISLKDVVAGDNLAVLNIKSRCGELKLPGEPKAVFLKEEHADCDSDFILSD